MTVPPVPRTVNRPFAASPSQERMIARTVRAIGAADLVILEGRNGSGRTSLLHELQRRCGGKVITNFDVLRETEKRLARRFEECIHDLIQSALEEHDVVYFDGVTHLQHLDRSMNYARFGLISGLLKSVLAYANPRNKTLVVTVDHRDARAKAEQVANGIGWDDRGVVVQIPELEVADYEFILGRQLDDVSQISFPNLYSTASKLTPVELTLLSRILRSEGKVAPTTEEVIEVLDRDILKSNVDVADVEAVSLDTLVGIEALVSRLDRTVLLPLNEPDLARELRLERKHGVLLYGPPGTGKTTIGRALAHMMKGKFFMIDGDFVHDAAGFYVKVDELFDQALRNSPSVIFIDDADVILSDPDMQHFGRYLLTKLDGIQGESMAKVCVMMTAMNIASMPAALLRSGRLEVWLETRAPDARVRADMIESYAARLPLAEAIGAVTRRREHLGAITEGFTPADLRRIVSDAAGMLGFDRHKAAPEKDFGDYIGIAVEDLRRQKDVAEEAMGARGGRRFH